VYILHTMSKQKTKTQGRIQFAILATDIVFFTIKDHQLHVLLGKVEANPFYPNHWAVIGGLIKPLETAEIAADRLLRDKAGLSSIYKEQLCTFSRIDRDPRGRVVSVAYLGVGFDGGKKEGKGTFETRWCPLGEVPHLAYDHNEMVSVALERLRSKIMYTNIARYLLPPQFTLSELQRAYEIVLNKKIDKRNFRKKILASRIIKATRHIRKEGIMRPAKLFTFIADDIKSIKML